MFYKNSIQQYRIKLEKAMVTWFHQFYQRANKLRWREVPLRSEENSLILLYFYLFKSFWCVLSDKHAVTHSCSSLVSQWARCDWNNEQPFFAWYSISNTWKHVKKNWLSVTTKQKSWAYVCINVENIQDSDCQKY